MTQLTIVNATDPQFSQQLTRDNMSGYYRQRNILWNQQRYDSNWRRYHNYEVLLNNTPIAIIRLSFANNICYVRELQVSRTHQGAGVGSKLLDWIIQRARAHKLDAIRLSVYTNNPARRLYVRKGFEVKQLFQGMYRMQYRIRR